MAKDKDLTISSDTVTFLIEQIGVNLTLIDSEFEKLAVALHPKKTVDKEAIKNTIRGLLKHQQPLKGAQ